MTVSAATPSITYAANGVATVYAYPFKTFLASHLVATLDGVTVTNYTVSGLGADGGGNLTFSPAPLGELVIRRILPLSRSADYQAGGAFREDQVDQDQDIQTQQIQQIAEESGRALKLAPGNSAPASLEPTPNTFPAFDAGGLLVNAAVQTGSSLTDLGLSSGSSFIGFAQDGGVTTSVSAELKKTIRASQYAGANFGAKLTAAIAAAPATGAIIDCTDLSGAQTIASSVFVNKPVDIRLGGSEITMGTSQIIIRSSGVSISGIGKIDENNSPTQLMYSGTASAILIQHPTTATAIFGIKCRDFEVTATGGAVASATALGFEILGARYCVFENISIYNFQNSKAMYFSGNGAVIDGFGATNRIVNPAISTCKYGVYADAAGGSACTHGLILDGFIFTTNGGATFSSCESWRIINTDLGGAPNIRVMAASDDCCFVNTRHEAFPAGCITIDSGVLRTQIISPSFINTLGGGPYTEITDNGTGTIYIVSSSNTDSKLRGLQAMRYYSKAGVTASIPAAGTADVYDMAAGGVWLVTVSQADGGTGWRGSAIVHSSGVALSVATIQSANITITGSGTQLRLTNSAGSSQSLAWSVMKLQGANAF